MAKTSSVEKNNRRRKLTAQYAAKRKRLKAIADDLKRPAEERFAARLKLAEMPRNGSAVRIRNRCEVTGRARGYLPQAQDVPQPAPRTGLSGPHPGHGQVELVRGAQEHGSERSHRRYADAHP